MSDEKKAEIARLRQEMANQKEESKEQMKEASDFKELVRSLTRQRTLKRRQTELFKASNQDELWQPTELTPVQETITITEDFQTRFPIYTEQERSDVNIIGKSQTGVDLVLMEDESIAKILNVNLNI